MPRNVTPSSRSVFRSAPGDGRSSGGGKSYTRPAVCVFGPGVSPPSDSISLPFTCRGEAIRSLCVRVSGKSARGDVPYGDGVEKPDEGMRGVQPPCGFGGPAVVATAEATAAATLNSFGGCVCWTTRDMTRCLRGSFSRGRGTGASAVTLNAMLKGLSISKESLGIDVTTRSSSMYSGGRCTGMKDGAGPGDCVWLRAGGPTL